MGEERYIRMEMPPLPYYLGGGITVLEPGGEHPSRRGLGMFDWLVIEYGELLIGENGRSWRLGAGDALLLLPDGEHYSLGPCERETKFYWLHMAAGGAWEETTTAYAASVPASGARPPGWPFANPYAAMLPAQLSLPNPEAAFRLLADWMSTAAGNRSSRYWQEQQFLQRWLELIESSRGQRAGTTALRVAERTEAFLRERYREDISNESLSAQLHFHVNYIVRCMKDAYGCTPMDYLQAYRLEQAKLLLLTTDWPVARVAEAVGFRLVPYFSGCFKRRFRVSPLQYRKQFS